MSEAPLRSPLLLPLGDRAILVRFADQMSEAANRAAIGFAQQVESAAISGVTEIVPNLVSVLVKYDPDSISFDRLSGELRLLLGREAEASTAAGERHHIAVRFDGEDLPEVAALLGLSPEAFIHEHNFRPLRVLATGFAPGFVYCGMHSETMVVPRRTAVRPRVEAGTVLFAAGQTAVAATPIPTGWHVIGHTDFRNFDPAQSPPTRLRGGDQISWVVA